MGKNWKGGKGGGGGGGGGNDFAACRGFGIVLGTCDAARERETSKELVNMLSQTIETLYPKIKLAEEENYENANGGSIQDMLKSELEEVRNQKHEYSQSVTSIQTGVKGIVLIKINRKDICPIALVKSVFDKVKLDRLPCSRHVVRLIPMKIACFPNEEELNDTLKLLSDASFGLDEEGKYFFKDSLPTSAFRLENHKRKSVAEDDGVKAPGSVEENTNEESVSGEEQPAKKAKIEEGEEEKETKSNVTAEEAPIKALVAEAVAEAIAAPAVPSSSSLSNVPRQFAYTTAFKARNHNVLDKTMLFRAALNHMPAYSRNDYRNPDVIVIVEAIKNLCGVSIVRGYADYLEFNLRKFQTTHCGDGSGSSNSSGTVAAAGAAEATPIAADEHQVLQQEEEEGA